MGHFIVRPVLKLLSLPYSAAEATSSSCDGGKTQLRSIGDCLKAFKQALLLNEDEPAGAFLGHIPFLWVCIFPLAHTENASLKKKKKADDLI